ncbi:MAG: FGGY-family carbohydrate kinase [Phycisphaerales bacterium]|nr:FGGY-family carbohydrate kinase [Phycisphaerales bacterium]
MSKCYLGIDVGTGSARAGVFDATGRMLGSGTCDITIWRPAPDFVEQSTDDIWRACRDAVRAALSQAGVSADAVRGIGFDATCSLAAIDADDNPVTISPTGSDAQNVIVWMDHRASAEVARINALGHDVLRYVGGRISPEMQTPKLCWLKKHLPQTWSRAARFLDLPDYLTYRATGDDTRSLCTTVCKWTYLGHAQAGSADTVGKWDESYFNAIGLDDFVAEKFTRIGTRVRPMGESVGKGLLPQAADELGLRPGIPVSVGIIDAHAGGIGVLGARLPGDQGAAPDLTRRLALIGGTSSCHMAVARGAIEVPGVWGPYFSAMVPDMWLTEGGQSATGALIDHVILSHARSTDLRAEADRSGKSVYELLNVRVAELAKAEPFTARLTRELHVLPYFHGNRSPRADATLRGMISGLRLADTLDELALIYLATIQAIAHGTRHIIDAMNAAGHRIAAIIACGGGTKNPLFLQEHADITGCPIHLPREPEAVLLGSAILGAVAAGDFSGIPQAMATLNHVGACITPAGGEVATYHDTKHTVFQRMYADFCAYRELMREV